MIETWFSRLRLFDFVDKFTAIFLLMTDFVQVDVMLTLLDEIFNEELEDVSSQKYKTLETRVRREVTFLCRTDPAILFFVELNIEWRSLISVY